MHSNRIIGHYIGQIEGPLLVFTAGVHGNETSTVLALQHVFALLEKHQPQLNGSIIGLTGNVKALENEVRFIDQDLNRIWLEENQDPQIVEHKERDELTRVLNKTFSDKHGEVYFFDLHATSSPSTPFTMISDTLRNRALARMAAVPVVLGLLENLHGMLIDATSRSGIPTILFQGGQEGEEETVNNHMGLVWKALKAKCGLNSDGIQAAHKAIRALNRYAPQDEGHEFYEIIYHYKIPSKVTFKMYPGFINFQPVRKHAPLGSIDGVDLKAPMQGQIFMPLYQKQGAEGFYLIKRIPAFWIKFSKRFRLFKYHNRLHWLLGVKKISSSPLTFRLDQQVTFLWAIEIFHLLGYIMVRQDGPYLFMTRREDERNPPSAREAIEQFTSGAYLRSELKKIKSEWKIPFSNV